MFGPPQRVDTQKPKHQEEPMEDYGNLQEIMTGRSLIPQENLHFGVAGHGVVSNNGECSQPKYVLAGYIAPTAFVQRDCPQSLEMSHVKTNLPTQVRSWKKTALWRTRCWWGYIIWVSSLCSSGKSIKHQSQVLLFSDLRQLPSLKLTYPSKGHFWRWWFSFSPGQIISMTLILPSDTWRSTRLRNEILAILRKIHGPKLGTWTSDQGIETISKVSLSYQPGIKQCN